MNKDQLYGSKTEVDVSLNLPHNNGTRCKCSSNKHNSYQDAIKNSLVPNSAQQVCEGPAKSLIYNQNESLSPQVTGVRKCLNVAQTSGGTLSEVCGNSQENAGITQGIIKPTPKRLVKDGLVDCFIHSVALNNKLNKMCRDLHIVEDGNDLSKYTWDVIDYCDGDICTSCTSCASCTSWSSCCDSACCGQTDGSSSVDECEVAKYKLHHSGSSLSTYNIRPHLKEDNPGKKTIAGPSKSNSRVDWNDKSLTVIINESNDSSEVSISSLPCNCESLLREIIKTDKTSSGSHLIEQQKRFELAMQNTCFSINDILGAMDKTSVNKCRLFCKLRDEYIDFKLKMQIPDGSMNNLFIDRVKIVKNDSQGILKTSSTLEAVKSEEHSKNIHFNSTINEISREDVWGLGQFNLLDKDPPSVEDKRKVFHKNEDLSYNISQSQLRISEQISKECNSDKSCSCSTESSKNTSSSSVMFSSNSNSNFNNTNDVVNEIQNEAKINDQNETVPVRFKSDVKYHGNQRSISTQSINIDQSLEQMKSTASEYDVFDKSRVFEILKTIFEKNEGKICSCNPNEEKVERKITDETSVEQAVNPDKMDDDSSSPNHAVTPVNSPESLVEITRVIPTNAAHLGFGNKYEERYDHLYEIDEAELNKRTTTPERKRDIESLLNKEDSSLDLDNNKVRSYSSRDLSEILNEGKKNRLSNSKDKIDHSCEYLLDVKDMEDYKSNSNSEERKDGFLRKNLHNDKNEVKYSASDPLEIIPESKNRYSSIFQTESEYKSNEKVEEKHNFGLEGSEEKKFQEKNVGPEPILSKIKSEKRMLERSSQTMKRISTEIDKSDHNCENFYLLHDITEQNRTSTPERERDIEQLLRKEDYELEDLNKDKMHPYSTSNGNILKSLTGERKKSSFIAQPEKNRKTDDVVGSRLYKNSKNGIASQKLSNNSRNVSHFPRVPRSISQKAIYNRDALFSPNTSLNDASSICECSDSESSEYINIPTKDRIKYKKQKHFRRKHCSIGAIISAICRCLRRFFCRTIVRKLKHLLKKRVQKMTQTDQATGFCVPNTCANKMQNFSSINNTRNMQNSNSFNNTQKIQNYSSINSTQRLKNNINNSDTYKYPYVLSRNIKRNRFKSNYQQPTNPYSKNPYSKHRIGVINKDKDEQYTCCGDRSYAREDWIKPKLVASSQTVNISGGTCDCNNYKKSLYDRKYMRRRRSDYTVISNRTYRKSSFAYKSSREPYPCCYYKNLAAKHLAEYLNLRLRLQEVPDSEVHCKECLDSTDSELKSMLNQYLKSDNRERRKLMKKDYEAG